MHERNRLVHFEHKGEAGQPTATSYRVPASAPDVLTEAQAKEFDPSPSTATLCDECSEWINDANPGMLSVDHASSCSLYPATIRCKFCGELATRRPLTCMTAVGLAASVAGKRDCAAASSKPVRPSSPLISDSVAAPTNGAPPPHILR